MKKIVCMAITLIGLILVSSQTAFAEFKVSTPQVSKNLKAGVRYAGRVTVRGLPKGAKITSVAYYYSGQGPFQKTFVRKGNKLTSALYTGNPGRYKLVVVVCAGNFGCKKSGARTINVK